MRVGRLPQRTKMTACAEATRDDDGILLEWRVQMLIDSYGLTFAVIVKNMVSISFNRNSEHWYRSSLVHSITWHNNKEHKAHIMFYKWNNWLPNRYSYTNLLNTFLHAKQKYQYCECGLFSNIIRHFLKKFWYIMPQNQTSPTGSCRK